MISTANITIQFGQKPLFENISVKFQNGCRYGLIGANGCGKSTFMKILSREIAATSGTVSIDTGERLGILRQDQFAYENFSVIDTVIMGHSELWRIKQERDQLYAQAEMTEADGIKAAELEMQFAELDGYSAESQASGLLTGLDIPTDKQFGPMGDIAAGWKLRVLLAQALFSDPDILLLDEPTNNLDINTIRWLEGILNEKNATMIIISHDRHFLNSVCTHMADLDYGTLNIFPGNYDNFMTAITTINEKMQNENVKKKQQITQLQAFVSRFSANASKAKQATSRAKQLEKIKLNDIKPSSRVSPYIKFDQTKTLYRMALEVEGLTKSFDEQTIFSKLNFAIEAGSKLAILGTNGIGKTTLIKTLLSEINTDAGQIKWSENTKIGYYAQDHSSEFNSTQTVFEWVSQWRGSNDDEQAIRSVLGKMLFSQDDIKKPLKVLSGGEQGRMIFAKLMLQKNNVLVLDEPTNHLDMESIEALNLALEHYPGTLIFVSHDRSFVSSVANQIIELKGDDVSYYTGDYESYLRTQLHT